jgi:hypothetical protein
MERATASALLAKTTVAWSSGGLALLHGTVPFVGGLVGVAAVSSLSI